MGWAATCQYVTVSPSGEAVDEARSWGGSGTGDGDGAPKMSPGVTSGDEGAGPTVIGTLMTGASPGVGPSGTGAR
jgi:hypothetical protein